MNATSYVKLNTYEPQGNYLGIYWNEESHDPKEGETEPYWTYDYCSAFVSDDRGTLISKIIRTQYSIDAEIATINNKDEKPEEYASYQAFRQQAKDLADGWINRDKT